MANQEELDTARGTLDRWQFKKMFTGDAVPFDGPGVVLKCRELDSSTPGEHRFQITEIMGAKNDAGAVAKSLLKHPHPAGQTMFVMLAPVPLVSHLAVIQELEPLRVR
jgi:hypothetical protein